MKIKLLSILLFSSVVYSQVDTFDIYSDVWIDFENVSTGALGTGNGSRRDTAFYGQYSLGYYSVEDGVYSYPYNSIAPIMEESGNKFLRTEIPAGCEFGCSGDGGVNFHFDPNTTWDEGWVSFKFRLSPEFNGGGNGGKIGLGMTSEYSAGLPRTESTEFSSYLILTEFFQHSNPPDPEFVDSVIYGYNYDRYTIGYGEFLELPAKYKTNVWYRMDIHVNLQAGFIEYAIDGRIIKVSTGWSFLGLGSQVIDKLVISNFFGGGGAAYDSVWIDLDDMTLWRHSDDGNTLLGYNRDTPHTEGDIIPIPGTKTNESWYNLWTSEWVGATPTPSEPVGGCAEDPVEIVSFKSGVNTRRIYSDYEGQSFTMPSTRYVSSVKLLGGRIGTSIGTNTLYLTTTSGGVPSTTITSATIDVDALSTSTDTIEVTFSSPVLLQSGTMYSWWIQPSAGSSYSNCMYVIFNIAGGYSGGMDLWYNTSWTIESGQDDLFVIMGCDSLISAGSRSVYYINPDSVFTSVDDVESLIETGDTILVYSGYRSRTNGFYTDKNIHIGTYGGTTPGIITGYSDVSGAFNKTGNVYSKVINGFTSGIYNWSAFFGGDDAPVNNLNFLLIDSNKYSCGRYPDNSYLSVDDTLSPLGCVGFTDNSLNGTFADDHWNGAGILIHSIDWITTKQIVSDYASNGTFNIDFNYRQWGGGDCLTKFGVGGRVPKYLILNHPNTLNLQNEWSFNYTYDTLSIYSTSTINDKLIEFSLHDTVLCFENNTVTLDNVEISGGNKYTVSLKNTNATIEDCVFKHTPEAAIAFSDNSNLIIRSSDFIDCSNGAIVDADGNNDSLIVESCDFRRVGIYKEHGASGYENISGYNGVLFKSYSSNTTRVFEVTNCRFDSCDFPIQVSGNTVDPYIHGSSVLIKNNLITNCGGYNRDDLGAIYCVHSAYTNYKVNHNGLFTAKYDLEWAMRTEPEINGIYVDDYNIGTESDSNVISDYHKNIFDHGVSYSKFTNNITYNGYKAEMFTDELAYGYTNNLYSRSNVFAPKREQTAWIHNRNDNTVNTYDNSIDSNIYLNWHKADANVWTFWEQWGSPDEHDLAWIRSNYGYETNGTQDNTAYDTTIIFYNWSGENKYIAFTATTAKSETGATVSDSVLVEPYYGRVIRFSGFSSITNEQAYTTMDGIVIYEPAAVATPESSLNRRLLINSIGRDILIGNIRRRIKI